MKKVLLLIVILSAAMSGNAQLLNRSVIVEQKMHAGLCLPFYDALEYIINDDLFAFDLSLGFPSSGKDYWEKLYNYPTTGTGLMISGLGNDDIFGHAYTLYGYINAPLIKRWEKISLNYQVSLGSSYISKVFDVSNNPLNRAIGSHLNIFIRLGTDLKIKLTPLNELVLEAGMMHFSNGKTRSPNYGINISSFSVGLNHHFNIAQTIKEIQPLPGQLKNYFQSATIAVGSKTYDNLEGKRYFISSITYNVERAVNIRTRIGIGTDLSYDGSISEALAGEDGLPEKEFTKLIRSGIHLSYSARYKHFITGIQAGCYIYNKHIVLTPIYSRLSVRYLLNENLVTFIAVKSHLGKADCLEFGTGYIW